MVRIPRSIKSIVLLVGFLGMSALCQAQPTDPETNPDVPISGIEILIGLGGLWGARKYAAMRKQNKSNTPE